MAWGEAERAAFLQAVRLFRLLAPETLRAVAARFRPRAVPRGGFAFLEGDPAATLGVVASGRIKVVGETPEGRQVMLRLLGPGELFGAAGGLGEAAYPASAVAQTDAVILRLPAAELAAIVRSHPDFALALVRELATRLREAEARIRELQTEQIERRLACTLLRLANRLGAPGAPAAELPVSRKDLAELAGTTLSTASRTLSEWQRQGIVATGRERVRIPQPDALVGIADRPAHHDAERKPERTRGSSYQPGESTP